MKKYNSLKFNENEFLFDVRYAEDFKKKLNCCIKNFTKLITPTKSGLDLIYNDRKRKNISLKQRRIMINELLSKWNKIVETIDSLTDEMVCIWDVDYKEEFRE